MVQIAPDVRKVLDSLPEASLRESIEQIALHDPVAWCLLYRKINGRPLIFDNAARLTEEALKEARAEARDKLSFEQERKMRLLRHRPFLQQPLRDTHPNKNYMKGRQVGVSEAEFSEAVSWLHRNPGRKLVYTFPRLVQLQDFSNTRITPAFEQSPRLRRLLSSPNGVYLKKIGESFLILRSAWESNLGEGVDADVVILDEKDRMKKGVEYAFQQSLKSSPWGWLREVSTPTLPGQGVHASFAKSDQQTWLVRCKNGHEQEIEYPVSIVQVKDFKQGAKELPEGAYEYKCRLERCRKDLDRLHGRWVPRFPSVLNVRGYHIPQLIAPWITATEVMQERINRKWENLFYNYVLGLPAATQDSLLNARDYEAACSEHAPLARRTADWRDVSVGIDWGHFNWVTVTGRNVHNSRLYVMATGVFEDNLVEELRSVRAIEGFIDPFKPDIIVADAGYGKDRNAYLLRRFGEGKVFNCMYNPSDKHSRTVTAQWSKPEQAKVVVDRTSTLKAMCRAVKDLEVGLLGYNTREGELLREHLQNLAPMKEIDDKTGETVEVIGARGDDHLAHTLGYSLLGQEYLAKHGRFDFDFLGH